MICKSPRGGFSRLIGLRTRQAFFLTLILALSEMSHLFAKISPLGSPPDWAILEDFHETITIDDFLSALESQFAPGDAAKSFISIAEDHVAIIKSAESAEVFKLHFAGENRKSPKRWWRTAAELGPAPSHQPLQGVRITLDPGHLGGEWARMEERWFQIGEAKPVTEGDMTLLVAKHLGQKLKALGADVTFTRTSAAPTTSKRPNDLFAIARASLQARGITPRFERYKGADDIRRAGSVQVEAEKLFYRTAEIRARAENVNHRLQPDLVLAIHFNAEPWGNPANPTLVDVSHVHLLVTGSFSAEELSHDDVRLEMLVKILNGAGSEERAIAGYVATALATATELPPYVYKTANAKRLSEYVWARNLLANRLFQCPVLYLEPYVMNSHLDYHRLQIGDYDGERIINGKPRESIYREYAGAVARGLADYYLAARPKQ